MSGFARRNDNHDSYNFTPQIALPLPYSHNDSNDFGVTEPGAFPFGHSPFNPFTPQFSSPYSHPGLSSSIHHLSLSNHSPAHSIPSTPDHGPLQQHSTQYLSHQRYIQSPGYFTLREALGDAEIEAQDSSNEHNMLSEPFIPPLEGFPDVREFDQLMKSYVDDLSVKKQDKALIHAKRARNIKTVLLDPKDTAIESAQFRFWVKKMFKLQAVGPGVSDYTRLICHEGKPVAIREKLFKILTRAHQQCQHGGRDKTSAQVRQIYSWVPKELISRFVKICPTCQVRRGGSRLTPPSSRRSSPRLEITSRSPALPSPPISRRDSNLNAQLSLDRSQADLFNQFNSHGNNGHWMDSHRNLPERQPLSSSNLRSYGGEAIAHLPGSVSEILQPFQGDMAGSSPSVGYNAVYTSTNGSSGQRSC
ncbi:integrase zinc binding domain-containing protein [Aspergillus saccharolyticus JOP 1030-1]|uniref:Integrase zinc-binding domain-containing protein n=1 Tax=Aspergillus saccharolyticus JOP 1030-1 TaxID=1450539 RepID=A0A318Z2W7_9EURO|nr:hypothetical protein BP01DRAFT_205562 [Aspergillus saccharolyticus JOP 1030-1]PYH40637.1 hypothetical protein BP01DRAFT_205562 [Aspergillus saccharolyticus JOP 1030-1]